MDKRKRTALDELRAKLEELAAYDATQLANRQDLGAINFESGSEVLGQTIELAKEARSLPLELLPAAILQTLLPPATQCANALKEIAAFKLVGHPNPQQQRDALLQQAQAHYDVLFTAVSPQIPYLSLKSTQAQQLVQQSAERLQATEQRV